MLNAIFGSFIAIVLALAVFSAAPSTGIIDTDQLLAETDAFPNLTTDDDEATEDEETTSIFDMIMEPEEDAEEPSTSANEPSRKEPASSSAAETTPANLTITESGYLIKGDTTFYAFTIENTNSSWVAEGVRVNVTAKDENGNIISADSCYVPYAFANSSVTIGGGDYVPGASTLEFSIANSSSMWTQSDITEKDASKLLYSENVSVTPRKDDGMDIGGELVNTTDDELDALISYVFFDESGSILWGDSDYEKVPANSTMPFSMNYLTEFPSFSKMTVYVEPRDL